MGGALDGMNSELIFLGFKKPSNDIHGMVIGEHGDTTMIPLTRLASYNGIKISDFNR